MNKLTTYINNVKTEFYKIIFPTATQIKQAFFAVLITVAVVALFIAAVDFLMSTIVSSVI